MTNRILTVDIHDGRLDPIESVLDLVVTPERVTGATRVRGRFVGPKCAHCSTLEVAYPIRERRPNASPPLRAQVVLPEASFWDPERPFLYHGEVELWEDDALVHAVQRTHGLRTFSLGPGGLRINGRPVTLQGVERDHLTRDEAAALHAAGNNTLLSPVHSDALWKLADQLGFLMLGRVSGPADLERANLLGRSASALGWVLAENVSVQPPGVCFSIQQGSIRAPGCQAVGRIT